MQTPKSEKIFWKGQGKVEVLSTVTACLISISKGKKKPYKIVKTIGTTTLKICDIAFCTAEKNMTEKIFTMVF